VARNVHEAKANTVQIQKGESKVNRDPPAFLILEAVGMSARQSLDEGGLAVIDMAGGTDDDVLHELEMRLCARGC
jgi:predicted Fe-Mo cluster-binding NifX family protein